MQNEVQAISYMAKHGPAAIAALLPIGCSSVLFIHIELKMIRAGCVIYFLSTKCV
jgi:hypothetical protein